MRTISHKEQQRAWEREHSAPYVLKQMDSDKPSGGVVRFFEWLADRGEARGSVGLEMCCGKGRNVIWLAKQKIKMTGFDFSRHAVDEAKSRARAAGVLADARFIVQDATTRWRLRSGYFDFVIDCFATTDIESYKGREFARDEAIRVLKPGGHLLLYTLSTDNEFHRKMLELSPAQEKNAFLHPTTGKFEKIFDEQELLDFYSKLCLVESKRVQKATEFFGKRYRDNNFYMIFRKQMEG